MVDGGSENGGHPMIEREGLMLLLALYVSGSTLSFSSCGGLEAKRT